MSLKIDEAKSLIIQKAEQLVAKLIANKGNDDPPFLSLEYASIIGIKNIEKRDLGKSGAVLFRFQNSPKIIINKNDSVVRQNFSCAHELGHLLFSELKLDTYVNTIEHRTFNPQVERRKREKAIEKLCDEAATELLMPTQIFQKYLTELGMTIYSIEKLANMFKVSIQSAAIRASEINQDSYMVLKWAPQKYTPNSIQLSWPKNKLINKIQYSPVNKIINPPSILHESYSCDDLLKGDISFKVGKQTKRFPAEIKSYGYKENRYIISLVFLNG